jgi:cell wall-associated NlpC family hydrolase
MKQQIINILQAIGRICWLLANNIFLLVKKGIKYVYLHRVQIMQHKVTLPILMVLSVLWTGFSSFRYADAAKQVVSVQADVSEEDTVLIAQDHYVHLTGVSDESHRGEESKDEPFQDTRLVAHIMDWIGTPHKDNTQSKDGTDCSGFVQAVYLDAHGIELNRNSRAMYDQDVQKIRKNELQEGDLVFFNTFGHDISHVGIYLKDGKFAHTSSSKGVTVSSLQESYYQKNYRGAGRVIVNKLNAPGSHARIK